MQIPKDKIIEMIKSRGDNDQAEQAQSELPEQVDTERDRACWTSSAWTRRSSPAVSAASSASRSFPVDTRKDAHVERSER
jgi:hypothetical protein